MYAIRSYYEHNIGTIRHVVITGGEPLLQKRPLAQLCQQLKTELNLHLTLETNGTLYDEEVAKWVDLFSISPKLSNSTPTPEKLAFYKLTESGPTKFHNEKRRNTNVLQAYINLCNETNKDLQLKYVVGKKSDAIEIESDFLTHLKNYKKDDILVMPLGASRQELALSAPLVMELAITNGWRYSPRVHIEMFGSKKGV